MGKNNRIFLLLFSFLFIGGCALPAPTPTPTVFTSAITPQATRLTTPVSSTAQPVLPENPDECTASGSIERYQIDSILLNGPLYFSVYFPPCYQDDYIGGYPTLYALHGQNFNDAMWIDLGMAEIADRLILEKDVGPFLVIMPYEEFFFRGADVNNFPAALLEEIVPWVEQGLNVCAERSCRAIGGISRGASWAMRIGLAEWEFFGAIGSHSLPTFRGDISSLPEWLEDIPYGEEPRIYLDTGRFDPEIKNAYRFEQVLNQKGIPHTWHLNEGRHNEEYWESQMENYLRWYSEGWE